MRGTYILLIYAANTTYWEGLYSYMKRHLTIVLLAVSIGFSFLLYGNTLSGQFVFDDEYFTQRPELRSVGYISRIWFEPLANVDNPVLADTYRPLLTLSIMANFLIFGESPVSFHVVNVVLHGLVTWLFFMVTRRITGSVFTALVAAALFMSMPIHTEAVAFIKAREELLGGMLFLASWLFFLKAGESGNRKKWLYLSAASYFLSCLSKEFLLVGPAIYFGVAAVQRKLAVKKAIGMMVPYGIVAVAYCLLWWIGLGGKFPLENLHSYAVNPIAYASFPVRLMTAIAIGGLYIAKTIIPVGLSATYRYNHFPLVESLLDGRLYVGVAVLGMLLICIFWKKARESGVFVGAWWFLVAYFPFSKFLFTGGEYIAERWMYTPSMGIALLVAVLLGAISFRRIVTVLAVVVVILYGILTVQRNRVWQTPEALYHSMIRSAPNSVFGYVWLARLYLSQGKGDQAEPYVQRAVSIYPAHHQVQAVYAAMLLRRKQYDLAEKAILRAINLKPESSSYYFYAVILTRSGRYAESQTIIDEYLGKRRQRSDVKFLSAVNYWRQGDRAKAREFFDWSSKLSEEEKLHAIEAY